MVCNASTIQGYSIPSVAVKSPNILTCVHMHACITGPQGPEGHPEAGNPHWVAKDCTPTLTTFKHPTCSLVATCRVVQSRT